MDEFWYELFFSCRLKKHCPVFVEDRGLSSVDFDYAFDEFKPISVKLLEDQTKKSNRMALHWSDIGGMEELKQELTQTIQWRFEVNNNLSFSRSPSSYLAFELFC